jgi:hypothetical protein
LKQVSRGRDSGFCSPLGGRGRRGRGGFSALVPARVVGFCIGGRGPLARVLWAQAFLR